MEVGRKKRENTAVISVRLPKRILDALQEVAQNNFRTRNDQIWAILETWLIDHGFVKPTERRRAQPEEPRNQD